METAKTILVIDDDEVLRRRLARAFSDRGFEVFQAGNGSEACSLVNAHHPKLAVLDLKLQNESGLIILKQLLRIDPELKVVVLTGYGTIATTVEALRGGAVNYLTKPVDADTILAAFAPESATIRPLLTPPLAQVEWDHIQRVVNDCGGNISHASKALGMHRRSLQRKLTKTPRGLQ